jgi:hypothetical protein
MLSEYLDYLPRRSTIPTTFRELVEAFEREYSYDMNPHIQDIYLKAYNACYETTK